MPPTDPIEGHVGAMIGEATRLHKEALTYLDKPKADPLPQLREAARLLNEAEVLASDAASYLDATQIQEWKNYPIIFFFSESNSSWVRMPLSLSSASSCSFSEVDFSATFS